MTNWVFALALTAGCLLCKTAAAVPPSGGNELAKISEQLSQILRRLDAIEERLTQLESDAQLTQEWWVDERGVMRTGSGRSIGFWGIDGPVPVRLN